MHTHAPKYIHKMSVVAAYRTKHRKGGPNIVFGRPVREKSSQGKPRRAAPPSADKGHVQTKPSLSSNETSMLAEKKRMRAMKQEAYNWVHRRDKDYLRLQEFKLAKQKLRAAAYSSHGIDFKELFRYYDTHKRGSLDLEGFVSALRRDAKQSSSKRGWSDKTINKIFQSIDLDNSGFIEFEEFEKWLSEDNSNTNLCRGGNHRRQSRTNRRGSGLGLTVPVDSSSPMPEHHRLSTSHMLSRRLHKQEQLRRFDQSALLRKRDELVDHWRKVHHQHSASRIIDPQKLVERLDPFRGYDMKLMTNQEMARRRGYGMKEWGENIKAERMAVMY